MRLTRNIVGALFWCLGATIIPAILSAQALHGPEFRVMSFNLRFGTADDGENSWPLRNDLVFRVIGDFAPEVLGVQEALKFQLDELQSRFPGLAMVGVGRDDGVTAGEYAAILFQKERLDLLEERTFWLSDTPGIVGSKSWGNDIPRICTWARFSDRQSGINFYVYNLHLDHQSQASRERSVELLTDIIANREHRDPYIVTGDFNAGEDNAAMRYLRGEIPRAYSLSTTAPHPLGLRDSFRMVHPESREVGTFNGFEGTTSGEKIDAVLVSHGWDVRQASILQTALHGRYPSDHFPVVATVVFNASQPKRPTP